MRGHVVAIGGGGFWDAPADPRVDALVLSLARRPRPRVCFLGTASGDAADYRASFYRNLARHDCVPADLTLFPREVGDLEAFLREQDVFWVGGGSTANLLAVWRGHGLDGLLRDAWEGGAVLAGVSAGMNCWFEACTTDSFGLELAPLHDGLGFLPGSACPHFDAEPQRRPLYTRLVRDGELAPGWAVDEDAALVLAPDGEPEAVAWRDGATAYRVEAGGVSPLRARRL